MSMGTRKSRQRQEQLWVMHTELATAHGHPFYRHVNALLDQEKFDEFAEAECAQFYCSRNGRPSLPPGTYFRGSVAASSACQFIDLARTVRLCTRNPHGAGT